MSLTVNAKTFTADSFNPNHVVYIGTGKTATVKDDVILRRYGVSKATVDFSGMSRTAAKLTRTLTLTNAKSALGDAGISVEVFIPVGYTAADVDTLLNDFGAFVASASMKSHVKSQQITF